MFHLVRWNMGLFITYFALSTHAQDFSTLKCSGKATRLTASASPPPTTSCMPFMVVAAIVTVLLLKAGCSTLSFS